MNDLLQKYNDYLRLRGCKAEYEFSDGSKIEVQYEEKSFAHLLGLHKLKDIQLVQFWLDKSNKSVKDAVINFNPTLINSKIKSDYILFEERPKEEYNHMGIAKDDKRGTRYIETFFISQLTCILRDKR